MYKISVIYYMQFVDYFLQV